MAESPDEGLDFSTICPYLHSREDPATAYAYPALANRCYCPRGPKSLGVEHQATFCLGTGHKDCPFFVAQQEAWSRHINRRAGSAGDIFQDWRGRLERVAGEVGFVIGERLPRERLRAELTRTIVVALGVTALVVAAVAILALLGGVANMFEASTKGTPRTEALSASSISTPTATFKAVALPVDTQTNVLELNPSDTPVEAPTGETTSMPLAIPTQVPTSTSLPTATDTPTPTSSLTATHAAELVKKSTATFTPTVVMTPTSTLVYAAPVLLNPPDGIALQKNTILRWSSDHELNSDELFDVLVWPEASPQQPSFGSTTDRIFPIDFKVWGYFPSGKFFWTIRIKRVDGTYLSPASPPFSFIVNENGPVVPPPAPPPTSAPPPTQPPKPTPKQSPPPP